MAKGKGPMGMGNMAGMMKQMQKMQDDMAKMQQEIEESLFTSTTGGGAVSVTLNGKKMAEEITIDPELLAEEDSEMICDMLMAAFNESIRKIDERTKEDLGGLTGGLNLPGGLGF